MNLNYYINLQQLSKITYLLVEEGFIKEYILFGKITGFNTNNAQNT